MENCSAQSVIIAMIAADRTAILAVARKGLVADYAD
jgi:hypothetical protein